MRIQDAIHKMFDVTRGRHTFFTGAFFIAGNILHWFHRLDGTYIGFMSSLMGFILGRSISADVNPAPAPPIVPPPAQ